MKRKSPNDVNLDSQGLLASQSTQGWIPEFDCYGQENADRVNNFILNAINYT